VDSSKEYDNNISFAAAVLNAFEQLLRAMDVVVNYPCRLKYHMHTKFWLFVPILGSLTIPNHWIK